MAGVVSPVRRKSTTFPICKLWHRFQPHETPFKASKKWCYRSFEVALFRFLWTRTRRHWCETLQTSEGENEGNWTAKIPEMFASIPSCGRISLWPLFSPYVISIDNSSFHKRIIKQTLIKICQLHQTIGDVFRGRINFVLLCKLHGV